MTVFLSILNQMKSICFKIKRKTFGKYKENGKWKEYKENGIPFVSKSKGKLSPWSYAIQFERSWKYSFLSAYETENLSVAPINYFFFQSTKGIAGWEFLNTAIYPMHKLWMGFFSGGFKWGFLAGNWNVFVREI